jgi:post-segregation antitoxin (ccd killing protein)
MPRPAPAAQTPRRPTNITLSDPLLAEARAQRWLAENRPAMQAWNDGGERQGLRLAAFRPF